jgi:NAD(P)-dependent dehydrogenase (short-subunit alcohol dehydrogenase family)
MQDKYVLITGGTGGLGMSVTKAVLAAGAKLVTLPYREQSSVNSLQNQLTSEEKARLRLVQADLSEEATVANLVAGMGQVDVLIQLVGGFDMGRTEEYSFADWQKMFDLNLNTTFLLCKYCLHRMRQTGYGRIVTIGSRGAISPAAQLAAYSAAKAGVVALTQSIAEETKDKDTDITANCVLPSVIDTPRNRADMGIEQAWAWVKPESLAGVICFLASEGARDIRGAAIPVYGKA